MTPTPSLYATLLCLGLLTTISRAQEPFLGLEDPVARMEIPGDPGGEEARGSRSGLPSLRLANRGAILLASESCPMSIGASSGRPSSWEPLPDQDAETGAWLQRSDLATTSLGSAGGFFSATLGVKSMQEKSEWSPLDTQGAGSIEFAWRLPRSAFAGVAGLAGSYTRQNRNDATFSGEIDTWTAELYLGGKAYVEIPKSAIWAYAGAGASFLYTEVEAGTYAAPNRTDRDSDWGVGVYAQLGVLLRLNRSQSIGIEYRGLFGTNTSFFGTDVSADYNQFSFVFLVAF